MDHSHIGRNEYEAHLGYPLNSAAIYERFGRYVLYGGHTLADDTF